MTPSVWIGTSGYTYKSWDKTFYGETPKRAQLEFYATQFPTVEINATFYRLPSENMVKGWRDRVPAQFVYALKGSRFITHMKKLVRLDGALDRYFDRIAPLRKCTAVILWQLPGILKKDLPRLNDFLAQLPRAWRHAVEFRHPSWYDDETFEALHCHNAAHVALSSRDMPQNLSVTSDIVYIRFHGLAGGAAHNYIRTELVPWARFISDQAGKGRKIYVYFNNDINVRAPENARMLMEMVGDHAVQPPATLRARSTAAKGSSRSGRQRKLTALRQHLPRYQHLHEV